MKSFVKGAIFGTIVGATLASITTQFLSHSDRSGEKAVGRDRPRSDIRSTTQTDSSSGSSLERKARLRDINDRDAYLYEIGAKRRSRLGDFQLIDHKRKINRVALEKAGLTEADAVQVQAIFDKGWKEASELVDSNTTISSNSEGNRFTIKVKADPSRGNEILNNMKNSLARQYGDKAAEILLSGFNDAKPMGAFGRQDQELEIHYDQPISQWKIEYNYKNPKTGDTLGEGSGDLKYFQRVHGDWFTNRLQKPDTIH